jgi:predicted dehydrogenase
MQKSLKFLVFGLGSMGKRRVRCLKALKVPVDNIHGFDLRDDRCSETNKKYGIITFNDLDKINLTEYDIFIISTPPDAHSAYCKCAIDNNTPAFVEASVLLGEVTAVRDYNINKDIYLAPSCTLRFHPAIKAIKEIVKSNIYGAITNFTYHSGSYLPDWHPWENISDFYAFNRTTSGGREIVPFELEWLIDITGRPTDIKGYFLKTIDLGAEIEDTYSFVLKYPDKTGAVIVDVASRYWVRNLVLNMEKAQIQWRWDDGFFRLFEAGKDSWITLSQPENLAEQGYNKNIIEQMYIDEIQAFINGINDRRAYPNSIEDDIYILELLNRIEESDGGF